ncbi:ABC transporter permease [Bacillus sp. BGMRC 2118]|nr:ABC transporter permease [Bacillus sp. BGMRC 2118]
MANLRKSKSATVSLLIFILVASLLLNIGLMVITQINTFFDHKTEQLNDPHLTFVMDQASYHSKYNETLTNYPEVKETEVENALYMNTTKFTFGNGELDSSIVILDADAKRNIGHLNFVEKLKTPNTNDIFVPYSFKTNGGYELGDRLTLTYQDKDYEYRISGFFETTIMATNNLGVMKFMVPNATFTQLSEELDNQSKGMILSALMEDTSKASKLNNDFIQEVEQSQGDESSSYIRGLDIELVKSVNTLTINIIATILVAFAAIIVLVALIVIRFRVSYSIEEDMRNIGALKAIGYTSWQILSSILLQFTLIVFCGSIVGIALSYVLMPFFGRMISTLSGLIWVQTFDVNVNFISILVILICVVAVTLLSAIRVRKILPVAALRGGIPTHSFRKNYFPLDRASGSLHFLLGIKSMLAHAKQNMMVLFIIIALTFATVFSSILYYNIATDKTAFVDIVGAEPGSVMITVNPEVETSELLGSIEQMNNVRKVNIFDLIETRIDNQTVYTNVTDQYNQLENNVVYEGRQPVHENEVSISWVVSDQINKGIGDTVEVEYGGVTREYLITGLSQSIGNLGQIAGLTMEGIQQLQPEYKGTMLYVYLDGITNKSFINNVQKHYGDHIVETLDIDENIEGQTGMYTTAVFGIMLMVLMITFLVVVTILYLVIKTMILKRKKGFGVMKAIGYSTVQLMNQISISILPVISSGVVIGGLTGYFLTNPMLAILLSSAGVKRMDFTIYLPVILMYCAGILILSYIVSMFVARRIKKITAYGLIIE